MAIIDREYVKKLRLLGFVEGTSTLVLFGIAMPLKYWGGLPLAVTIAGAIHGVLFLGLVALFVGAVRRVPLVRTDAALGIAAAVMPFGPFVFDRKLRELVA